jgi:TonB-dependent starch-binding outer membrane protein SusC
MKRILTILLFLFLGMQISFAQGRVVTGTVTSAEDGTTLPGVTVMVLGTNTGVTTDIDGKYQLTVPGTDAILKFSFIGFKSQEFAVSQTSTINVALELDLVGLEEIVVIGYGTSTKEALTGAVEVVGKEELEALPVATLENALQGNVSGLMMANGDGQPGSAAEIRIRGIGSINASSEPLYVIDGIPVQTGAVSPTNFGNDGQSSNIMSTINPNDIESISVLKDASATAIYGSRGANGVIIITTKGGKSGKAKINFSAQTGFSDNAFNNLQENLNAAQYKDLFITGYTNRGEDLTTATNRFNTWFPEAAKGADTDWIDEIYNTGKTQQYNLDISGGADGISYFASLGYYDQEGVVIGTDFERFSARLNIKADLTDKLTITNNITVGRTTANGSLDGTSWTNPMHNGYMIPAVIPIYNEDGLFYAGHADVVMDGANPVGMQVEDERWQKQTRVMDNLTATYKLRDDLTFKSAWSIDLIGVHEFSFRNARYGGARLVGGSSTEGSQNTVNWIGTQTLNYNKIFGDKHSFDALLGYEAQRLDSRSLSASGEGFPNPNLRTLASAANPMSATSSGTSYSFASMFSRFTYNYDGKYYATASFRRDGSSRFGENSRWGNFWSLGGSWRVTQEDFMSDINWVNDLKLRVSYGITGNASIGNFAAMALYGFGNDYDSNPGSSPSSIGNPYLTWEGQSTLDVGVDIFVFDRLSATVNYFNRKNSDLLLDRPLSLTTGFDGNLQNVGDMLNTGIEVEMNAQIVKTPDFKWDLGFNITFLKNEVTRLDEPIIWRPQKHAEGHDYYEFYMWHFAGVNPQTGAALWYEDETLTTTTENIKAADRMMTGKSGTPGAFGGMNTNISYKGFSLSAQLVFVWDKWIFNNQAKGIESDGTRAPRSTNLHVYENMWRNPGDETTVPIFYWGNKSKSNTNYSTRFLYDGTYVRVRDLTFAYTFESSVTDKLNISSLKVFAKANNFLTWTRDDGYAPYQYDPESSVSGYVNGLVPKTKSITFGVNVGF